MRSSILLFIAACVTCSAQSLSEDEIGVYRAFLKNYLEESSRTLNIGKGLISLKLSDEDLREGCLAGIPFRKPDPRRSSDRVLTAEVVANLQARLVDPVRQDAIVKANDPSRQIRAGKSVDDAVASAFETGLLRLSEIAFDSNWRFAVMEFSFRCGGLCGHGGKIVFEKTKGQWQQTKRHCGGWVS